MNRKRDPRNVLEDLKKHKIDEESLEEIVRAVEQINTALGEQAEMENGSFRLPYSSDPNPIEKQWQNEN